MGTSLRPCGRIFDADIGAQTFIRMCQGNAPHLAFPAGGRDPFPPWAPAFVDVAGLFAETKRHVITGIFAAGASATDGLLIIELFAGFAFAGEVAAG
jgi:hypothetical protein